MNNSIQLNPKYIPLFQSPDRYFVITGGRGSGKSFGISLFLLNLTYEKGHKVLFSRYTLMSAQTSIIPEFIEKIDLNTKDDIDSENKLPFKINENNDIELIEKDKEIELIEEVKNERKKRRRSSANIE